MAPDLLGLGYTEVAPGQSVAPDAQVAMLVELLDALGIDKVDLVANDSGGAVAQMFLASHPRRVRTLLLTNCDAEPDCPPPALLPVIELAREGQFVAQWLAPWLADKELARSAQGLGGLTYTHRHNPSDKAIDYYLAPLVADPARTHAYAVALERNWLAGIGPQLRRSRVPARIVWAGIHTQATFADGQARLGPLSLAEYERALAILNGENQRRNRGSTHLLLGTPGRYGRTGYHGADAARCAARDGRRLGRGVWPGLRHCRAARHDRHCARRRAAASEPSRTQAGAPVCGHALAGGCCLSC